MNTPKTGFRLGDDVLKAMDSIVDDPPECLVDAVLGKPRDRTDLIKALVKLAYRLKDEERPHRRRKSA